MFSFFVVVVKVVSYAGHNSRINNVSFTHSKYALTACGGSGAAAPSSSSAGAKTIRLLPSQTQPHFQMLSCSADGTARMWRYGNTDNASVVFSHMKHSVGSASAATASAVGSIGASTSVKTASFKSNTKRTPIGSGKSAAGSAGGSVSTHSAVACQVQSKEARNRPFADEITYASYFYMDKFAVLVRIFAFVDLLLQTHFILLLLDISITLCCNRHPKHLC